MVHVSASLLATLLLSSSLSHPSQQHVQAWTTFVLRHSSRHTSPNNRYNNNNEGHYYYPPLAGTTTTTGTTFRRTTPNCLRSGSSEPPSSDIPPHTDLHHNDDDDPTAAPIHLFNSKVRGKQPFTTLTPNLVHMYTCGPTVYDAAHIGNFRAFLTYDVLKRVFTYFGYTVRHVCNITDVDDKIILKCRQQQQQAANGSSSSSDSSTTTTTTTTMAALTQHYELKFQDDLRALNIVPATLYPRATEHIPEMVEMILTLRDNGLAYQSQVDDSWYFDTTRQPNYGQQLVNVVDTMELQQQDSQRNELSAKRHFQDFCLWKAYKPNVDLPDEGVWDIPELGKGRPGWHLECSAMARKYLGDTLDVHCGGIDLKFPHHENEIAQSEGTTGKQFCQCWIHNGFVNIGEEKMSKSLGNFVTLRDACPTPQDVRAYRYLVVTSQYRTALSFTEQAMQGAKNAIKRMDRVMENVGRVLREEADDVIDGESEIAKQQVPRQLESFEAALRDDLSMPRAAAALFSLIKIAEGELKQDKKDGTKLDRTGLKAVVDAIKQMDRVFGIFYSVPLTEEEEEQQEQTSNVPGEVMDLVGKRTAAKEAKDWDLADSLRTRITELGFSVKDVRGGDPVVSRLE